MHFIERLIQSIKDKKSVVCMGLDPRMDKQGEIPKYLIDELKDPSKIILEFNKNLIDHTSDLIPVVKPQIAFYEKYEALTALKETIKYAHKKDLLVILDSKRNDIGSTSEAYAYSTFKVYNADACTIIAYLGFDGIKPYLSYKEKGLFILVKTSNPSSKDFQDIFSARILNVPDSDVEVIVDHITLERNYIHMAKLVSKWGQNLEQISNFHNLGVVVGATYPQELKTIRKIVKNSYILMPGFGAQGAAARDIKSGFNENGLGGIVNSSRGITYAYFKNEKYPADRFGEAARDEIIDMNKKINKEVNL
ncbi:MAG: orotidine-5'-phosphate decarboxylase [Promethearchaeota archaeon Loki_b31]|nr:MAG: orotidine-5'-phosphate decarboxylase [Candidatus Lokiarchaeota archaeon Loki_b31]